MAHRMKRYVTELTNLNTCLDKGVKQHDSISVTTLNCANDNYAMLYRDLAYK